jgi:Spy/CpxP family protein refolding chaperone
MRWTACSKRLATVAMVAGVVVGGVGVASAAPEGGDRPLKGPNAGPPATQPGRGAMRGERGAPGMMREVMHKLLADLNVTPEQHGQIKGILDAHKQKMDAWRSSHEAELKALREAHEAARESGDRAKLQELRTRRQELMKDAPKPADLFGQIRDVLNEEQRKTFDARVEEAKEKLRSPRAGGPGGPQGKGMDGPRHERKHKGEGQPSGTGGKLDI